MAAATTGRRSRRKAGKVTAYPLGAGVTIFGGTLVSLRNDGYAYPARSGTATDVFIGVAQKTVVNATGAAGDQTIVVDKEGEYVFTKAAAVQADLAAPMYASDDSTLTATSANNQLVGYPVAVESGTELRIRIDNAAR